MYWNGWSGDLHYLNMVLSYAKFEDAYLDDCTFSALIGLMVFMVAALDNPYRGKINVRPHALERVYRQMIHPRQYPGPRP